MALAESAARSGREHSATGFQAKAREPHLLLITKVHNPSPNYALFLTHCNALPFSALLFFGPWWGGIPGGAFILKRGEGVPH